VLSVVTFLVLARLLNPEDFGLVALASVFVALLGVVTEQGFAHALVQREDLEPSHLDTAFWSSVLTGSLLAAALVVAAEPVSRLLDEPDLAAVLRVLSLAVVVTALSSTPQAILQRDLAFRSLAIRELVAALVGAIVGVGCAVSGLGVWALVAQILAQAVAGVAVLWIAVQWRPGGDVSWDHFRELAAFGWNVVGVRFLNFVSRRGDNFLIGVALGTRALGIYAVAYRVFWILTDVIARTIATVAFPVFSRLQSETERIRRAYLLASQMSATVATPIFVGTSVLAGEIVDVLLGTKWDDAVPVLQILCLVGILHANQYFNISVLMAVGAPQLALFLTVISSVTNLIAFSIGLQWGIVGVAAAYAIREYLFAPLSLYLVRGRILFRWSEVFRRFTIPLGCSLVMAACIVGARDLLSDAVGDAVVLALLIPLGGLAYILALRVLAHGFMADVLAFVLRAAPRLRSLVAVRALPIRWLFRGVSSG
jgi:O-antigen/teichoic acid export membrane protein